MRRPLALILLMLTSVTTATIALMPALESVETTKRRRNRASPSTVSGQASSRLQIPFSSSRSAVVKVADRPCFSSNASRVSR